MPRRSSTAPDRNRWTTTNERLTELAATLHGIATDLEGHLLRERLDRLLDDAGYQVIDHHHHRPAEGSKHEE